MASRTTICKPAEVLKYLGRGSNGSADDDGLVQMLMPLCDQAIETYLGWNVVQRTYEHLLPDVDLYNVDDDPLAYPVDVRNGRIGYWQYGWPIVLQVPMIPLRSIQSMYADLSSAGGQATGDFPPNTLQILGTDYYADFDGVTPGTQTPFTTGVSWSGHLRRWLSGVWPVRQRSILINYTAGILPDELDGIIPFPSRRVGDIKYAAIVTAAAAFLEAKATQVNNVGAQGPIVSERIGDAHFQYDRDAVAQMTGMLTDIPWKAQLLLQKHRRMQR